MVHFPVLSRDLNISSVPSSPDVVMMWLKYEAPIENSICVILVSEPYICLVYMHISKVKQMFILTTLQNNFLTNTVDVLTCRC